MDVPKPLPSHAWLLPPVSPCGFLSNTEASRAQGPHLLNPGSVQGEPLPCLLGAGPCLQTGAWKVGTTCLLAVSPAPHLPRNRQIPLPGGGSCLTGGRPQQKGWERQRVRSPQLHPRAWKWSWLGSRFSSKSEANAQKLQPYPLTEDGKMPV